MTRPSSTTLQFEDREDGSFDRATSNGSLLRPFGQFAWTVSLTDTDRDHKVKFAKDGEEYVGSCDCKAFKYHDGPCAHLWALFLAERREVVEVHDLTGHNDGRAECPACGTTEEATLL